MADKLDDIPKHSESKQSIVHLTNKVLCISKLWGGGEGERERGLLDDCYCIMFVELLSLLENMYMFVAVY